jgi:hypothetical protein
MVPRRNQGPPVAADTWPQQLWLSEQMVAIEDSATTVVDIDDFLVLRDIVQLSHQGKFYSITWW